MTRREVEDALIQMGKAMSTIVGAYAPNANHIMVSVVNGTINVDACEWDGVNSRYIEKNILKQCEFADGSRLIMEETA